jgi:uncharacterized protein GlcG (DUF336 family)
MRKILLAATSLHCRTAMPRWRPGQSRADHRGRAQRRRDEAAAPGARARHSHRAGDRSGQAANASCLASTYKTTTLVADSAGVPIVVISNDGAAAITQRIAMTKAQAVLKYKMSSGEVLAKAGTDAALAAEIKANPMIETARPGAFAIQCGQRSGRHHRGVGRARRRQG